MATYDDLVKANATINTTNIKGKEYAEVNQRIKAFRMVYPEGMIVTELLSNVEGVCVFKATVSGEEGNTLGVGHAYEKETSSFINKTSYIENCETSAVGRALGMAGFGIDTSVCSAEELTNAINNQGQKSEKKQTKSMAKKDRDDLINRIVKCADEKHIAVAELCASAGVGSLEDLPDDRLQNCMNYVSAQ